MANFKLTTPDGKSYQVSAPDAQSAYAAFQQFQKSGPAPVAAAASGATVPTAPAPAQGTAPIAAEVPGFVPGQAPNPAQVAALAANWGKTNSGVAPPESVGPHQQDVVPTGVRAFGENFVNSMPLIGPGLHNLRNATMSPADAMHMDALGQQTSAEAPVAATAGSVAGTVAPFLVGGEIPAVAKVLGTGAGGLLARSIASGGSMAAINGADTLARGGSIHDALTSAAEGGAAGVIAPGAGDLVGKGLGVVGGALGKAKNLVQGMADPAGAAQNVIGSQAAKDLNAGYGMTAADEANAAANSQPIINADRFGPNVQTLARTSANIDPTAKQALTDMTQDRFLTQNDRGVDFINRATGGNTDAVALQAAAQNAARKANAPAYRAAYKDPNAQAIFTPEIGTLMGATPFRKAISNAVTTGNTDAALHGFPPVTNPFRFNADGSYTLVKQANGSVATPNLQFWDQVQRNLGENAKALGAKGKTYTAGQNWQLRSQLNDILDNAVPAFQTARQGAAGAFGAEDALEAGKNFVGMPASQIPAAIAAHGAFTAPEKKMFATGFASNLISKVNAASPSTNVINNVFSSPNAKAQIATALSPYTPDVSNQLEHFLRGENIMQGTKNAVQGGSNTFAQQAAAAALTGYGTGAVTGGWNPLTWNPGTLRNAGTAAGLVGFGRVGMKALGVNIDQKVMQNVAKTLASRDPAAMAQVYRNASRSQQTAGALKAIQHGITSAMQAGTTGELQSQPPVPAIPAVPAPALVPAQ